MKEKKKKKKKEREENGIEEKEKLPISNNQWKSLESFCLMRKGDNHFPVNNSSLNSFLSFSFAELSFITSIKYDWELLISAFFSIASKWILGRFFYFFFCVKSWKNQNFFFFFLKKKNCLLSFLQTILEILLHDIFSLRYLERSLTINFFVLKKKSNKIKKKWIKEKKENEMIRKEKNKTDWSFGSIFISENSSPSSSSASKSSSLYFNDFNQKNS